MDGTGRAHQENVGRFICAHKLHNQRAIARRSSACIQLGYGVRILRTGYGRGKRRASQNPSTKAQINTSSTTYYGWWISCSSSGSSTVECWSCFRVFPCPRCELSPVNRCPWDLYRSAGNIRSTHGARVILAAPSVLAH